MRIYGFYSQEHANKGVYVVTLTNEAGEDMRVTTTVFTDSLESACMRLRTFYEYTDVKYVGVTRHSKL